MDWDKLRVFHAAAQAGSFTHAGDALNMSQSAVSRQVSALEKDLKVALFHRHARGLQLTEQGDLLFSTVGEVMNKLQTAETLLADSTEQPAGDLRITAPIGFGTVWLTQRLREFMELYPEIRVELNLNDEQLDISMRAADVAIWTREPQQPDLIRRTLFSMNVNAYASPAYVNRFGAPQTLEDFGDHRLVTYYGRPAQHLGAITWLDTAGLPPGSKREAVLRVNSVIAMKYAISSGIGIGMLPDYLAEDENDLIQVLSGTDTPDMPILYVYPEELKTSRKVHLLRDYLISHARKWKYEH